MALRLGKEVIATLVTEGGEVAKAYFLPFNNPKVKKIVNDLQWQVSEVEGEQAKARENFDQFVEIFNELCVGVDVEDENEAGEYVALNPENFPDWKERLLDEWKFLWALEFRSKTRLSFEKKKNLDGQSNQDTN